MTDLLASYRAAGPGHDEMLQSTGAAREAWALMAELAGLSDGVQLADRARDVAGLLQDSGVRQGAGPEERPWLLDPIPVLFDEHEWAHVEAGLEQRALLLDHLLTDLYGEATLLTSGVVPPALVLGHPGFVRAVNDIRNPGPHQLFMVGTDLARNADGTWQVLADRAQVPIGMGFAMQDRRIIAEVLSGLYRRARIRRVGPFFQAVRRAVREAAPAGAGHNPRSVLLTPGPFSPAAFDQAYLATMLGYPLVEGEDLVVERGRVWMRSLGRLEPVDVIVRHLDAEYCDPLDLRGDSRLGVAGLVQAARDGVVTIVNPLGSGVLDNPGLLTYLPRIARQVLGEELLIPSTVTYWCGERSMCSHVIANLDRLVVRSTDGSQPAVRGWELTISQRADLAVQIAGQPHLWVGQERVEASTTPAVHGVALEARPTQLRTYAVASGEGYQVMSGGVARVARAGSDVVDPSPTDAAKDVWVLSSQPYTVTDPWVSEDAGPSPARVPTSISPGAAEDLFWFGRYTERAEGVTRLVRAVGDRFNDFAAPSQPSATAWAASHGGRHAGRQSSDGVAALAVLSTTLIEVLGPHSLSDLVLDARAAPSVGHAVARMSRCANSVRDQMSTDTWTALSSLERALSTERRRQEREGTLGTDTDVTAITARLLEGLLAIAGILAESMVRDVGWCLMDAGRRLERAQQLLDVLLATFRVERDAAVDTLVLESVLIAHESVITYRRRYQATASVETVLDLLLKDATNPRSLRFQLRKLADALAQVPASARSTSTRDSLLADVQDLLEEMDTGAASEPDGEGHRTRLAESLESMRWRLRELGEEIARVHFTHPVPVPWLDASGTFAPVPGGSAGGSPGGLPGAGAAGDGRTTASLAVGPDGATAGAGSGGATGSSVGTVTAGAGAPTAAGAGPATASSAVGHDGEAVWSEPGRGRGES
ncbi:circularly permuted type 2 ATP-grasp protein [Miniimonas sp. S16]|uniref:circularly permuted type 2 ATP-grasp protein n=1 Tax=Miniimonas sp. S16 TaxID=2171623 RepID=UPI000D526A5C|nr:circularly permuted type 2 ATP-grasp protein [Miniimonas sp. S16]